MFRRHAKISPATAFRRLWPLTRPERIHLRTAVPCQTISVACGTAAIQVFSYLTDKVLTSADPTKFWRPAGLWLTVALLGAAVTFAAHQLTTRAEEGFRLRCRDEVFQHAQRLPPHYYENNPPGDLLARFTGDIDEAEHVVASGPVKLLNTAVSLLFFAGAALWLRWELALLTFAAAPVLWLGTRRLSRPIRTLSRAERDRYGELVDALDENLANMPVVQAYNRHDTERDRVPTWPASPTVCPTATTPPWAPADGSCPAASSGGWPSRGRWCATPRSSSWTSRRRAWTPSPPAV